MRKMMGNLKWWYGWTEKVDVQGVPALLPLLSCQDGPSCGFSGTMTP